MSDLRLPKINRIELSGRITKELELKSLPSGVDVLNFSIASEYNYKDKEGEWQTVTTYIPIMAFAATAVNLNKSCKKGSAVLVYGRLENSKYVDKDNNNRDNWGVVAEMIYPLEWLPKEDTTTKPSPISGDVPF